MPLKYQSGCLYVKTVFKEIIEDETLFGLLDVISISVGSTIWLLIASSQIS